ncbi:MAG: AMP-binding protein [Sandarakinorhabdus sp.]|nr:AMP-binding protein [Sandarakinorhabdus sp.]
MAGGDFIPLQRRLDNGPDWARRLERHGDAPALFTGDGAVISYRALLAMADAAAAKIPPDGARRFVALQVHNDVASIAAYLGCLRAGHPVLLLDADGDSARILTDFTPDVVFAPDGGALIRAANADLAALHPDLAVLLSTSGSTGSPKLVRLSADAIAANAAAIIAYLEIGRDDRAVTTLAMHYSFGMSVVNSHLMAGAALIVTDLSVTHPDFAALLDRLQPTSLSGVPYLFDLLDRSGVAACLPHSIRTLAQAGGRMPPEKVREWTTRGAASGFRFFAMYGQTEAGPRMAWLPPDLALAHPDCIGRPIPGGRFTLVDEAGAVIDAAETPGELVYHGPNVMMGYAIARADLALGAGPAVLHTGDIAVRAAAGLYRITGRASRFAKIAGLRIGFDDVEAILRAGGHDGFVSGDDGLVVAHVEAAGDPASQDRILGLVAAGAHIPESAVAVVSGPVPRLATGKTDYAAIRRAGAAEMAARGARAAQGAHPILVGFRQAFNRPALSDHESFQGLGGDSLSYVNASVVVEKALGSLPPRWEEMSIAALVAQAEALPAADAPRRWTAVGTETLLRLLALTLVICGHGAPDETTFLRGGSTILFLIAGYNLARFQKSAFETGRTWPALSGALERMILPYYVLMVPLVIFSNVPKSWGWFALVSVFTVSDWDRRPLFAFWFIETVFHALLVTILLFQLPPVRRFSRALPFVFGLVLLALAMAARVLVPLYIFDDINPFSLTVDAHYFLYALGWLALVARGRAQQIVALALAVGLACLAYGVESPRPWWLGVAMIGLLFVPSLPVPRRLAAPLLRLASASYFIYIIHVVISHVLRHVLYLDNGPVVNVVTLLGTSAVGGLLFERLWLGGAVRLSRAVSTAKSSGSPSTRGR